MVLLLVTLTGFRGDEIVSTESTLVECVLLAMRLHVMLQRVGLFERCRADGALERTLPSVDHAVTFEMVVAREAGVASVALKRLLALVRFHLSRKICKNQCLAIVALVALNFLIVFYTPRNSVSRYLLWLAFNSRASVFGCIRHDHEGFH